MQETIRNLILAAPPLLLAIILHEVAHGYVALKLGDRTAKAMGRLTLNPISHIDPIGTVLLPAALYVLTRGQFVFGYAKPVPINPFNFKNPRKGMAISAAAGPGTNVVLGIISMLLLNLLFPFGRFLSPEAQGTVLSPLGGMLVQSVWVNAALAALNLLPVPPLDGGRVLVGLLPRKQALAYSKIEPFGFFIVIILIYSNAGMYFIRPVMKLVLAIIGVFDIGGVF